MVTIRFSEALGVKKMTAKSDMRSGFVPALLCIAAFLAIGMATVCGQSVPGQIPGQVISGQGQVIGQASSTSAQDSAYCVGMGYNYAVIPGVNGNQPICQFPDNTWCDARAFATGTCNINQPGYYNPYYFNTTQSGLEVSAQIAQCRRMGGGVRTVHTPYGDVDLCVFADGSSVDLRSLRSDDFGGTPGAASAYASPVSPFYGGDSWYYYAYSWLNAP
jgi:putative hemolysin